MTKEGLKNDIRLDEFNKVDNLPQYFQKLYARTDTFIENSKMLGRLESKRQLVNENYESIPDNATIMEEYVKCGKGSCCHSLCPIQGAIRRSENSHARG